MELITQWSNPAWRAQHRTAVVSIVLMVGFLTACIWYVSQFWPDATTQGRPLDRDEAAYFAGVGTDTDAREQYMLTKGVRVISPDVQQVSEDDEYGSHYVDGPLFCPDAFPVIGTRYGVYYLASDDLFPEFQSSSDQISVCFANDSAARAAGYMHGPV